MQIFWGIEFENCELLEVLFLYLYTQITRFGVERFYRCAMSATKENVRSS